ALVRRHLAGWYRRFGILLHLWRSFAVGRCWHMASPRMGGLDLCHRINRCYNMGFLGGWTRFLGDHTPRESANSVGTIAYPSDQAPGHERAALTIALGEYNLGFLLYRCSDGPAFALNL